MDTGTMVGSINRRIKIRNSNHANAIARTYINDDKYLMMDHKRMLCITEQLLPMVTDDHIKNKLEMMKEVLSHDTVEHWNVR